MVIYYFFGIPNMYNRSIKRVQKRRGINFAAYLTSGAFALPVY